MANTKISELPTGTANVADALVGNQSGTSKSLSIGTNVDAASGDKLLGASADGDIKQLTPKMAMINDYQEADWIPTLLGGITAGSPTYTTAQGVSIVVGNLVLLNFRLQITDKGGIGGDILIGGLPYEVASEAKYQAGVTFSVVNNISLSSGSLSGFAINGTTHIKLTKSGTAGISDISDSEILDTFSVRGTVVYVR